MQSAGFGGDVNYEYLILGAGPAGLQMGYPLSLAGHSYLILEAGDEPAFLERFPRHRAPIFDEVAAGSGDPEVDLRFDGNSPELSRLNLRANTRIVRIEKPHASRFRLTGELGNVFSCRRLIVAAGVSIDPEGFDDSLFAPECRPELVQGNRFPTQTPEWESVNVPGLYFAGTLTQASDLEPPTPGFDQGFRYNVRALFRMLEKRHHRRDWPSREVEPTPEGLVEATLARLNRCSAMWQQFGFFHDVIVVEDGWDRAFHYEEMPLAYIHQGEIGRYNHYYTITLEFGKREGGRFVIARAPEPGGAEESVFVHPVIRRWSGRQLVSEKHLPEDLFGEWTKPEAHIAPLRYFFMEQLLETVDLAAADDLDFEIEQTQPQRLLRIV